jgi:hypothetical protein
MLVADLALVVLEEMLVEQEVPVVALHLEKQDN